MLIWSPEMTQFTFLILENGFSCQKTECDDLEWGFIREVFE